MPLLSRVLSDDSLLVLIDISILLLVSSVSQRSRFCGNVVTAVPRVDVVDADVWDCFSSFMVAVDVEEDDDGSEEMVFELAVVVVATVVVLLLLLVLGLLKKDNNPRLLSYFCTSSFQLYTVAIFPLLDKLARMDWGMWNATEE